MMIAAAFNFRGGRRWLAAASLIIVLALLAVFFVHDARPAGAQGTTVTLSTTFTQVNEGSEFEVTVTLSANPSQEVTIPITATRLSSEAGDITNESTLTAGVTIGTTITQRGVRLTAAQDADAQDEKVTYTLGTLPTGYTAGTTTSVTVTILDDETKPTVTLGVVGTTTVDEGSNFNVLARLSAAATADVTIPITVTRLSSESGDITGESSMTSSGLTIDATRDNAGAILTAAQDADTQDEKVKYAIDRAKLGELGYTAGATTSVTVTILDDETKPTVTFASPTHTVAEGSRISLRATRSAAPGAVGIPVTITLGMTEETDLNASNVGLVNRRGLIFGSTANAYTVLIGTNLDLDTDDETFTVAIDTAKLAELGYAAGANPSVAVTIVDDGVTTTVSLSAAPNPVVEGSGVTVTATLSKAPPEDVTIPLTVALGTAEEADLDATELALLRTGLTFTAGTTTSSGTLATEQDADAEDETFTVSIDADSLPSGAVAGMVDSVAVTIQDDEFTGRRVSLSAPDTVDEGRPVVVYATLSKAAPSDVVIPFTGTLGTGDTETAAELADFAAGSQALFGAGLTATIPEGEWTAAIELATEEDDDDAKDETFTVSIDAASLPSGYGSGVKISHTVTIDDDEGANPDPDLLTGLTLQDGGRELFLDDNRLGDQVGLGGPDVTYTVQVSPGRRWIDVTPVWTNPEITSVTGLVRYTTDRSAGGTLTWSSSGATQKLDMHSALGSSGHPLLVLTVTGAKGHQPYLIYFQHNFDWTNANDRLGSLHMRTGAR